MFLTATNLPAYLLDKGLVRPSDIVGGDLRVVEVGRRNRNFRVERPDGPWLFLKQVPTVIGETVGAVAREVEANRMAAAAGPDTALGRTMPVLLHHDPLRHALVFEAISHGHSLALDVARDRKVDPRIAGAIGRVLGRCQVAYGQVAGEAPLSPVFPRMPHWVFMMPQSAEQVMPNMGPGSLEIVRRLRATPELAGGLVQLGQAWRRVCLIHGDLKFDNILLAPPPGSDPAAPPGEEAIRLVDWELADVGEPLWDVAGLLCGFLHIWLSSTPIDPAQPPLATLARAPVDAPALQQGAQAFWRGYMEGTGTPPALEGVALTRALQLVGARLCLLAFEYGNGAAAPFSAPMGACLEWARAFLTNPLGAGQAWLGLAVGAPVAREAA